MTDTTDFGDAHNEASQTENFEGKAYSMDDLPSVLRAAALRLNWTELMPVQVQTIPYMLGGQDVMVQSQTGSGKTGAFLLPILNRIETGLGAPQALVLVPTRELAVQVTRDAEELARESGIRPLSIYGGVGYKAQIQGLESGAQLIIGTPGRILDHLLKGNLNLDRLKIMVFDEADRMLSMGFYPDMKQLQRYLPRGLQSAMFSATYPGHVKRLAQQFLKDPIFVSLSQDQVHVSDVLHVFYKVPAMQKSRILVKIIEQENPASAIIFCNTKADVHFVSVVLRRFGYDVGEISADLTQAAREEVLEKLRLNKLKFLVATDVAARGIDIHELSHVFQYQPPQDHEAYVHRTGRTGRAGAAGVAISLVSGMEEIELEQIAKKFAIPMVEHPIPADEELETLISQRAVFLLEARLRKADNIQKERMQRFMRTVGELATNDDSRALLAMLVDEFYQDTFHAPLEQPSEKLIEMARPGRPESRSKQPAPRPAQPSAPRSTQQSAPRPAQQSEPMLAQPPASMPTQQPASMPAQQSEPTPAQQSELTPAQLSEPTPAQQSALTPAQQPESRVVLMPDSSPEPQPESGRPEGEKRRRKRSRKKPANSVESGSQGPARTEPSMDASDAEESSAAVTPVSQPAPVAPVAAQEAPRPEPRAPRPEPRAPRPPKAVRPVAVPPVELAAEAAEAVLSTVGDAVEDGAVEGPPATAPKKRRRRRPRKSSGPKPEAGRETSSESGAPSPVAAPAPAATPAAGPAPAPRPAPVSRPARGEVKPKPESPEGQSSRTRDNVRPSRKKPTEPQTEPPKAKKKIFLE